jgi:tetratricopeptide (TPR) repeat protein
MKRNFILLSIFLQAVVSVTATEIGIDADTDTFSDDGVITTEPQLSLNDNACIEGLSHFGASLFSKDANIATDRLLAALAQTPHASRVLAFLLKSFRNQEVSSRQLKSFIAIAEANPRALPLNIAALILADAVKDKEFDPLETKRILAENCVEASNLDELNEKEIELFENIIKVLSGIYLKQNKYEKGHEFFEKLFEHEKLRQNNVILRQALIFYTRAARNAGTSRRFLWLLPSQASLFAERKQELLHLLQVRSTGEIKDKELIKQLTFLQKLGMIEQAQEILLEQLGRKPDTPVLLVALGELYSKQEKYFLAAAVWRKICAGKPGNKFFRMKLARNLFNAKLYSRAAENYREILKTSARSKAYSIIFMLALCELQLGKTESACRLIKGLPSQPHFWEIKAHAESVSGDEAAAFALLSKLIAASKKPDKKIYFFWLSTALKSQRRETQLNCLKIMEKRLDTSDAEVANTIGYSYADLNENLPEAKKLIGLALEKKDCPEHLDSMAWVLFRMGKYKEAAEYISKAIAANGKYPNAVIADHAGDIFHALGDKKKALNNWLSAVKIYCFDLNRKKVLKKIKELEAL